MRRLRRTPVRAAGGCVVAIATLALAGASPALGQGLTTQPVLGMPAGQVELIGSSPGESAGETWAEGKLGAVPATVGSQSISDTQVLLRYTNASGSWHVVPLDDVQGNSIAFKWVASEVTQDGGVALIGSDPSGDESLVTRDPGGAFSEAPAPPSTVLFHGETLFSNGVPTIASTDESGHVGVMIAPASESPSGPGVLHYAGGQWTRETICNLSTSASDCRAFHVTLTPIALSASSPRNAWLLASFTTAGRSKHLLLFERETGPGGNPVWVDQTPKDWLLGTGARPPGVPLDETSAPPSSGAVLTASGSGAWVDFGLDGVVQGSASLFVAPAAPGGVVGTWCFPTTLCPASLSLGAALPTGYGSIAWPGTTATDPGTRIITGLPRAAVLSLPGGASSFAYETTGGAGGGGATFGPGGESLSLGATVGGAAFTSPTVGWLGVGGGGLRSAVQVVQVTGSPGSSVLRSWPVAFRDPLLAVTPAPGSSPGDGNAEALAVGVNGEIARYKPGEGWVPEFIYNSAGAVQTPTLRAVAWPTSERAFAIGDDGAMFVWRSETGLWEPDPAKPLNFHANLTAIAFAPSNPTVGYAVGKQGVLLAYDKTWTQQPLPAPVAQPNFTSVAFAGGEAIASYRTIDPTTGNEAGGILVNDGSGWRIDQSAQALLSTLPANQTVMSRVAGLPDGGAVAAGPGVVLERDSAAAPWRFSSSPLADSRNGNISALAAIRDGASVRALVAVDDDPVSDPSDPSGQSAIWQNIDNPPAVGLGQPPLLIAPDPLPSRGFLLRETASGWADQELDDYPNLIGSSGGGANFDLAGWPDPVLALDVDAAGEQGWAVGGETGGPNLQFNGAAGAAQVVQTAAVMRFGAGPSPPISTSAPISIPAGQAAFALGGGSGCAEACSDQAAQNLGPDTWLSAAISRASQIGGLRAFVYAGQRSAAQSAPDATDRELARYDDVLSSGGSLPVYAAASALDVSAAAGGPTGFAQILGAHVPAGTSPPGTQAPPPGTAAYSFNSTGNGGTVHVIVLDYSSNSLSINGGAQLAWLASQLDSAGHAGIPAIVVGSDDITDPPAPNFAADAAATQQVLLTHGASAYLFYDAGQQNVSQTIGSGANKIPAYGSGTLGYVTPPQNFSQAQAFLGASGFLLVSVDGAHRNAATNRAPVTATLVPNAGEIALDATDGTLLRRSQVALFQGLARRPIGGEEFIGSAGVFEGPDPYTVLPETCLGSACGQFIQPAYKFSSSSPTIGNFVEHDPNSTNPRQILQDAAGHPIPDPASGLFCAFNPGTTTATITSGGLSYSLRVTVQQGSVEEPCGTVAPINVNTPLPRTKIPRVGNAPNNPPNVPVKIQVPPPAPPQSAPLPPGAVTAPAALPRPAPVGLPVVPTAIAAFPFQPRPILPVGTFSARPLPPIGFGTVPAVAPLPVRVVEEQKKEEEAVETQQNYAAYRPDDPGPLLPGLGLLVLALAAGTGVAALRLRRRPRGGAAYARTEVRRERRW